MTAKQLGFYARVSLAFSRSRNTDLIAFSRNVVSLMTGNTSFPTPLPSLAAVTTAIEAFEAAVQNALEGGRILVATRNARRNELLALMRSLAAYVTGACNGDVLTLQTSGFEGVRVPSPVALPAIPERLSLTYPGGSGVLLLRFRGDRNARNYSIERSVSASGPWTRLPLSSSTRVAIGDLTPGTAYWVRAAANGSAGSSDWSGPVTAYAT